MKSDLNPEKEPIPEGNAPSEAQLALRQLARLILAGYQHRNPLSESGGTVSLGTEEK